MNQRKKRALRWLTLAAAATGTGLVFAPSASAHEVPPIENCDSTYVLANGGNALDYALNHTQHEHVNAPLLGLGPLTSDPVGYTTGHVVPFAIDVTERAGCIPSDDHGTGGEAPPAEEPGHEH
jgi:hypothetical protein